MDPSELLHPPADVCPEIACFVCWLHTFYERHPAWDEIMGPLLARTRDSRRAPDVTAARRWLAIDAAVREASPRALRALADLLRPIAPGVLERDGQVTAEVLRSHAAALEAVSPVGPQRDAATLAVLRGAFAACAAVRGGVIARGVRAALRAADAGTIFDAAMAFGYPKRLFGTNEGAHWLRAASGVVHRMISTA